MKKFLKALIWLIVILLVIVVGGAYVLPGEAVVERHVVINAPADKVFAVIGHMRRFNEWSPWAELDPNTQYTFEGPETGTGQKMTWSSKDPNVGNGSLTIVEFTEATGIATDLDLGDMGTARASMRLAAVNGGTGVTWSFKAPLNGIAERWAGLMFNRWIGADYERGLIKLKATVEKEGQGG